MKGRDTIEIDHPAGEEIQWDWFERRRAPWGGTAYVLLGTLPHSGRVRGVVSEKMDHTMIAQALGHQACRRGCSALFTKTSRLLADLAGGHADRTFEVRLRRWARPTLLILDDFAMREFTAAGADDLYELVTERQGKSLVITANRAGADWYSLFPNPVVAESILDRVVNASHQIHMDGKSYRPNGRPGRGANK